MCTCHCCLVTIFGSSTEISFKAREGERWLGDAAAVGSREHQCMLLANCSLTAPKRRLAGWRSQLPSNCNYYIQETTTKKTKKTTLCLKMDGKIKKNIVKWVTKVCCSGHAWVKASPQDLYPHQICVYIDLCCIAVEWKAFVSTYCAHSRQR